MDCHHLLAGQRPKEMRKEVAATRRLPFERLAKGLGLDLQDHEIVLAPEIAAGGFRHLRRRREMDVPVLEIDAGALESAFALGVFPDNALQNLIDAAHGSER